MGRVVAVTFCAAALALGGCTGIEVAPEVDQKRVQAYLSDKPRETHRLFSKVVTEDERNRVLNLLRAGLTAMHLGHNDLAERTFDEALLTIETIYGGDEKAAKARGTFTAEDRKTFRGEPYERAMAFYYRGILYLMDGDYENARASFKSGILQDTLAEQEEYRQDFALLEFLEGWSSQCNGNSDLAAEAYAMAKKHNAKVMLPEAGDNLLVLADLGHAPIKYTDGAHGELLKIKGNSKKGPEAARIALNGRAEMLRNTESILWQAQSRGGRELDAILEGKARFKEDAKDVSQAAGTVAQAGLGVGTMGLLTGNQDMTRLGGAMAIGGGLISLFASAAADATKPQADTRQWDNLPEAVVYGTYRGEAALSTPQITFDGESGDALIRYGGDEACKIAWTRSQSTNTGS